MTSVPVVLPAVRSGYGVGLTLLPVRADGSKAPDVPSWLAFKTTRPTIEQMREWDFGTRHGVGVIAGPVSQHVECWDFDDAETFQAFVETATATGLAPLVSRIREGYEDRTPGGGVRWLVSFPPSVPWSDCTLARRPGRPGEPAIKTLIELPTFSIIAPSNGPTHPSGRPYVHVSGDFSQIAKYTHEERTALLDLARTFDQMPRREAHQMSRSPIAGSRPGDDFNRRQTWPALLESHGWTHVFDRGDTAYWRRPGKTHGVSATTNHAGSDLFYPFTGSTAFEPDKSYTKFGTYAVLEHGGDFGKAAAQLAAEGYGEPVTSYTASASREAAPVAGGGLAFEPVITCLSTVQAESVVWIWPGRVAVGKLALLVGDPGLGKSWLTLDVAARVSAGRPWPDGAPALLAADVLLLSAEDGLADTIRPRLDGLGADVRRVHHLAVLRAGDKERSIQLADMGAIEQAIVQTGARVVTIDPLSAYLGSTDSHRDAEVRGLMAPLAQLAERTGVAVLGVMHLSKGTQQRPAIYRAVGSIAFTAAARLVMAVAADPDHDGRRLLVPVKQNICAPAAALAYRLADGHLTWEPDPVSHVDVDALLSGPPADRQERREVETWLRDMLEAGPMQSKALQNMAREAGLAWRTVERAKHRIGIEAELVGFGASGRWYWRLADSASPSSEPATNFNVAVSERTPIKTAENTAFPSETATLRDVAVSEAADEPDWVLADDGGCPPAEAPFAEHDAAPRPGRCVVCDCPLTHPRVGEPCARCRRALSKARKEQP